MSWGNKNTITDEVMSILTGHKIVGYEIETRSKWVNKLMFFTRKPVSPQYCQRDCSADEYSTGDHIQYSR